jgi:hypothetical protein
VRATSLLVGFVAWLAVNVGAQSIPAFDVATVKPSGPDSPPMSLQRLPGGLVTSDTERHQDYRQLRLHAAMAT